MAIAHWSGPGARRDQPLIGGTLAPEVSDGAQLTEWANRIAGIPAPTVERICEQAADADAITTEQAEAAASFLNYRKDRIVSLLQATGTPLQNVQWSQETGGSEEPEAS